MSQFVIFSLLPVCVVEKILLQLHPELHLKLKKKGNFRANSSSSFSLSALQKGNTAVTLPSAHYNNSAEFIIKVCLKRGWVYISAAGGPDFNSATHSRNIKGAVRPVILDSSQRVDSLFLFVANLESQNCIFVPESSPRLSFLNLS